MYEVLDGRTTRGVKKKKKQQVEALFGAPPLREDFTGQHMHIHYHDLCCFIESTNRARPTVPTNQE